MKRILFIIMGCLLLVGCSTEAEGNTTKETKVEGIEASLNIQSNSKSLDEGFFQGEISNETDQFFTGEVTFYHSSFKFWSEEVNIPPGKSVVKELKTKYIQHPKDSYRYTVEGDFSEGAASSDLEYKVFQRGSDNAFNVQLDEVTKESVTQVVKEMYAIHGDGLLNIDFYDGTSTLADDVLPEDSPQATYYGSLNGKEITIGDEKLDIELP